jgi:Homing endonuclease associated repeat/Homeodomain-like domain
MARNLDAGIRLKRAAMARKLRERGLTQQQIADELGISRSYASGLLTDPDGSKDRIRKERYRGTCVDCGGRTTYTTVAKPTQRCMKCQQLHQHGRRKWTRERIIADIQRWNEIYGEPPKSQQWLLEVRGDGTLNSRPWPHVNSVQKEFGSWSNGLEAAGFKRRINYERTPEWKAKRTKWSKEKIVQKIRQFHDEHGRAPRYGDWYNATEETPSHTTVSKRFGTFAAAIREAGLEPAPRKWPIRERNRVLTTPFEQREGKSLLQVVREMNPPQSGRSLTEVVKDLPERK